MREARQSSLGHRSVKMRPSSLGTNVARVEFGEVPRYPLSGHHRKRRFAEVYLYAVHDSPKLKIITKSLSSTLQKMSIR